MVYLFFNKHSSISMELGKSRRTHPRGVGVLFFCPNVVRTCYLRMEYARTRRLFKRPVTSFRTARSIELMRKVSNQSTALPSLEGRKFRNCRPRVIFGNDIHSPSNCFKRRTGIALAGPHRAARNDPNGYSGTFTPSSQLFGSARFVRHAAGFCRFRLVAFFRFADRADCVDLRASGESEAPHTAAPRDGVPAPILHCGRDAERNDSDSMVAWAHFVA